MKKTTKLLSLLFALITVFSSAATVASAASKLTQVKSLSAYNIDDDEINLKWAKVKGAQGYQVYRYSPSKKKWVSAGKTKNNYIEVDCLYSATSYKFKVRAYGKSGSKTVYSPYSAVLVSATEPDEAEGLRVTSKGKNSLTLKWNKISRATRYQVYVYDSAKKKYVLKATVSANTAKLTGLKSGTTYKIKVRAYLKANGKTYYGDFSDVLSAKTSGTSSKTAAAKTNVIGTSKASSIALNHAKLTKSKVREFACKLDKENGIEVYEVEFEYKGYDYEYEINAVTGKIISIEKSRD